MLSGPDEQGHQWQMTRPKAGENCDDPKGPDKRARQRARQKGPSKGPTEARLEGLASLTARPESLASPKARKYGPFGQPI
jgi:hypothetical protein